MNCISKRIPERKLVFAEKLKSLLDEYDTCLIIQITNIGSKQILEMRKEFRDKARFLFGKNTLIRKVIRDYIKTTQNMKLIKLMDLIRGNCGLVFTNKNVNILRKELISKRKQYRAKTNGIAPRDVIIPIGPTNMEPMKTSIFQSMDIETRINKGQIQVISEKCIIKKGEKINPLQTSLLSQLNIKPFWYGIKVKAIYENGYIMKDTSFIDLSMDDIVEGFYDGLYQIASFCFTLRYPTMINIPYTILNGYRQTLGLSMMSDIYSWDGLEAIEYILEYAEILTNTNNSDFDDNENDDETDDESSNSSSVYDPFQESSEEEDSSSDQEEEEQDPLKDTKNKPRIDDID